MDIHFEDTINEDSLENFLDSITRFGLPSFMEYGVAKGFITSDEIAIYVERFIEILARLEMYEDCHMIQQQYKEYYEKD